MRFRQRYITATAIAAVIAAVAVGVFYASADPESPLMPKCVFRSLTGLECPGCGFQRALHAALNGDIAGAWVYNPFLFFIVPVGILYICVELFASKDSRVRRRLVSPRAIMAILSVTIIWWVVRNL